MLANPTAIEPQVRALVGAENVRLATSDDAVMGITPHMVVAPRSERDVCSALWCANEGRLTVIPRGGGTKLGWGNPPASADIVLSLARLDEIVEHAWADLTVTVEAGCTIGKLQAELAKHGQRLAADPLWPERATVGGVLACNDTGALRHAYGGLRDLIIGVSLALTDGTHGKSGGKVVKNVAGYDLPKLATGSLGTLGIITRAVFRLHPLARQSRTLTIRGVGLEEMQRLILRIQHSQLALTSLQLRAGSDAELELDALIDGTEAGIAAQEAVFRGLAGTAAVSESSGSAWSARQALWDSPGAIAKLSVLPSGIAAFVSEVQRISESRSWSAVVQAYGVGMLCLEGSGDMRESLLELRAVAERVGGSFVVLRRQPGDGELDSWGGLGDTLPLMRALKQKFDPRMTLNPGRFVRGIEVR